MPPCGLGSGLDLLKLKAKPFYAIPSPYKLICLCSSLLHFANHSVSYHVGESPPKLVSLLLSYHALYFMNVRRQGLFKAKMSP